MAQQDHTFPLTDVNEMKFKTAPDSRSKGSTSNITGRRKMKTYCKDNLLLILTITGVVLGVALGFGLRATNPSADTIMLISFPGELLMRLLKMLIVPLVACSLVTGLASLDAKNSGKLGMRAISYYLLTSLTAVILGIILVTSIHPGDPDSRSEIRKSKEDKNHLTSLDSVLDLIRNVFPDNIFQACFQQTKTAYAIEEPEEYIIEPKNGSVDLDALNSTLATTTVSSIVTTQILNGSDTNQTVVVVKETVTKWVRTTQMHNGVNVLGIITFFTIFGILVSNMGYQARVIVSVFHTLNEIIFKMVTLAMWYSPIGIMSLIMGKILEVENPDKLGSQLGMYMVTVLVGLFIHMFIVLPGIYFAITRKNPYRVTWGLMQAFFTALGTASSTATLPVTFRCLEEGLNFDKRVTRFVLPIGATINMDGTALYEAVATIFIAQLNGIPLSFGNIVAISVTATCASIGAASIPSAGLVTMVMVLTSVGLPVDDISLLLTVDWFLDRFRTITNILGDSYGAGIVEHLSQKELKNDHHKAVVGFDRFREQENGIDDDLI